VQLATYTTAESFDDFEATVADYYISLKANLAFLLAKAVTGISAPLPCCGYENNKSKASQV
jgi:hypothetical protein